VAGRPGRVFGVVFAATASSSQISCDLTATGELIPSSCVNSDTGVSGAIIATMFVLAIGTSIAVGVHLYRAAGRNADAS
jgi:hypothetical protein